MLYRTMPTTQDHLSILGFGCMRLPQKNGRIDEERATRQIRSAIDQGLNYLDTAVPYHMGASESFLGRALQDGYRERMFLATKLPHWSVRTTEDLDRLLNMQLDNLQTDHIDYYLLHNIQGPSWERLKGLGVKAFMERAKADGRVRHMGFSSHADRQVFKSLVDDFGWEFCQLQYNILDEQNQAGKEGLKYAAGKGLGVIIMEPLRGGHLTKNIPPTVQAIWDQADTRRTPAEWALRWVWNHPEVTLLLSGMNEEAHIEENLRVASEAEPHSLIESELALINQVKATYQELIKVGCTGCHYCMPCPAGVNIPACFEIYNNANMLSDGHIAFLKKYMLQAGGLLTGTPSMASQCIECGKCEKVCPQHLPIRELLKDVVKEFEFPGQKPLLQVARQVVAWQGRQGMRRRK